MNTDEAQPVTAYSTVAPTFRVEGDQFHLIFWYAPKPAAPPPSSLTVERKSGPLAVRMTLPPAGFAIYQAAPGLHRLGPNPPPDLKPWQPPRERGGGENGAAEFSGQQRLGGFAAGTRLAAVVGQTDLSRHRCCEGEGVLVGVHPPLLAIRGGLLKPPRSIAAEPRRLTDLSATGSRFPGACPPTRCGAT